MADHIPLGLQTAYRDLLERQVRRPMPEVEGSVSLAENKGSHYWVVRRRIGSRVVETRLGPDNSENRQKAEELRRQNADLRDWSHETGRLVSQLRAARMPTPSPGTGKLINALARVGLFRSGGVLAGTHAYGLYALELGVYPMHHLAMTEDVDIAASRSVSVISEDRTSLATSLEGVGLRPVAGPGEPNPIRWETMDGVVLDVLTPKGRGGEAAVRHQGLGLWAQALSYLDFSLEGAIDAVVLYREGIPVRIPAPERFAVHKLIVAPARRGTHRAKSEKDLAQAAWLIAALSESRPFELAAALDAARVRGPKWRQAIDATLSRRPDIEEMLSGL
jgi:hypothetical protein